MKTILTVVGARPQFVKAASISRALKTHRCFREVLVHTGQHFDSNMSDVFFDEMDIPKPDFDLNIHSLGHGAMTGRMMEALEALLLSQKPDLVIIYGDTNSTLAGALTARKLNIPVAHVEAGLRSFNMLMPEEVNRIISDRISSILYCPTTEARANLLQEGFAQFGTRIVVSGDVMYDAALFYARKASIVSRIREKLRPTNYILCTLHRAENTDNPERLSSICRALDKLATRFQIVLPLHPRTRQLIEKSRIQFSFQPIEPVGYFDMISLLEGAKLVLTDSGGLQKEAYFFQKPCVTVRDQTEWVELLKAGANILTGPDDDQIIRAVDEMIQRPVSFESSLYGDGHAAELIANDLVSYLHESS